MCCFGSKQSAAWYKTNVIRLVQIQFLQDRQTKYGAKTKKRKTPLSALLYLVFDKGDVRPIFYENISARYMLVLVTVSSVSYTPGQTPLIVGHIWQNLMRNKQTSKQTIYGTEVEESREKDIERKKVIHMFRCIRNLVISSNFSKVCSKLLVAYS